MSQRLAEDTDHVPQPPSTRNADLKWVGMNNKHMRLFAWQWKLHKWTCCVGLWAEQLTTYHFHNQEKGKNSADVLEFQMPHARKLLVAECVCVSVLFP